MSGNTISGFSKPGIDRVVSVCEMKDIETWKLVAVRVPRYITASSYELICPDSQLEDFRSVTPQVWTLSGESTYSANCSQEMIRRTATGENRSRVNWLFQQFLKINAVMSSRCDEIVLIWDADTIPLRDLNFIDSNDGGLMCYHSREIHLPYFETVEKLLGIGKVCEPSFIAQCLPVRVEWVRKMVGEIESRSSKPYPEAVMSVLPGRSGSEFSEYETIGTWAMANRPEEIGLRQKNRWLRRGSSIFGENLDGFSAKVLLAVLSCFFDFVAVENWKAPGVFSRVARKLKSVASNG
ncbi:MAG: hypothetical protein ACSHX9_05115 [Luteolibacter sp.]